MQQSPEQLSHEEAVSLIRLATVGAGQIEIAAAMAGWNLEKQAGGWRIITQYFRSLAEIDHTLERGKALARYQMLFNACVRIQDWKAAAMIQSQIDKLTKNARTSTLKKWPPRPHKPEPLRNFPERRWASFSA